MRYTAVFIVEVPDWNPNILFCNRVHNPLKLFASTLSAFNCSLSCENTVSTLLRKRKINYLTSFDQLIRKIFNFEIIREEAERQIEMLVI